MNECDKCPHGYKERDKIILRRIAAGMTNKQIAETHGISISYVKATITKLMDRTESQNRAQLVAKAIEFGIIRGKINEETGHTSNCGFVVSD